MSKSACLALYTVLCLQSITTHPPTHQPNPFPQPPTPPTPLQTRPDATLKELSQLLKDVVPPARKGNARLEFNLVYPGPEGRAKMRTLGVVRNNVKGAADDARSLKEMRCVEWGDWSCGCGVAALAGWLAGLTYEVRVHFSERIHRYQVGDCLDIAVFNDGGGGGHGRRGSGGRGGGGGGGGGRGGGGGGWRR